MILLNSYSSSRPDLQTFYQCATVIVSGVKLHVGFSPICWEFSETPKINLIGDLEDGWKWHHFAGKIDAYRVVDKTTERIPIADYVQRQLEQAPSPLFGWEAPPAPMGVAL